MFDDLIKAKPKRDPLAHVRCRKCNSNNVKLYDKEKSGTGFNISTNTIYTRYKVRVRCYTCNTDYYISYTE